MIAYGVALAMAALAVQDAPVARWTFDGGAGSGQAFGRATFVDSPIGASGQMLALNGIDGYVQVDPPGSLGAGAGDFTVSLWICPLEMRDCTIVSRGAEKGWSLRMSRDGTLRFQTSSGDSLETEPKRAAINRWCHICLSIRRGREGKR